MDPLSALGVAAGVVQFIDFGTRLVSEVGQLYLSPSGRTAEEVELTTVASDLAQLGRNVDSETTALARSVPAEGSSEAILLRICEECVAAARELDTAIQALRSSGLGPSFKFGDQQGHFDDFNSGKMNKISKAAYSFATAIRSVTSFNAERWRRTLSDLRMRMMSASLTVLWEQSSRGAQELNRISLRQTEMVTSLDRIEANTRPLNQALIQVLNAKTSDIDPERREIIDNIWSSQGLTDEPVGGTHHLHQVISSSTKAQDASSQLLDQHSAYLAARMKLKSKENPSQFYVAAIMDSLRFQGVKSREDAIPEAYEKTFEWIYAEPPERRTAGCDPWVGFTPWLEESVEDVYWITGKPGAGKSTLMKFLTKNPRTRDHLLKWSSNLPLIQASFYFWNSGASQLQKSQTGLLRTLLLQCLQQMPSLCPRVCPRRWALVKLFGSKAMQSAPQWTWGELLESFSALTMLTSRKFNLALFIDGLDEFDGDHQKLTEFVKLFHRRAGAKILVSSRPENVFLDAFSTSPSLKMETFTTKDVETFVQGEFDRTRGYHELVQASPVEAKRLMNGIVDKAKGVFLWVSVVVRALCEGLTEGDNLKELQSLLDFLPTDLSALYSSIYSRIKPEYRSDSSQLFQIHNCSTTLLDAVTLHLAHMDNDEAMTQDIAAISGSLRPHIIRTLIRRLNSRTRGLLEVSKDGHVDYLHRSVREWTVAKWDEICSKSSPGFDPHLSILKALTVEIVKSQIWDDARHYLPTEFWNRACVCLYHASNVRDDLENIPFFIKVLDRLDESLGTISKTYTLENGALPLYRNVAYASLMSANTTNLPHWSSTQYTMTPDQLANSFLGLTAQFAVFPYVRTRITNNPKLLLKQDPQEMPILYCAVLGFEHYCRPDIADLAGQYVNASTLETRSCLVRMLLEKGALVCNTKKNSSKSLTAGGTKQGSKEIRDQIEKKRQFLQCISDADPRERQYWDYMATLFDDYMSKAIQQSQTKRSSFSRLLSGLTGKGRGL
ncbi:Fc.00g011280.m01.CDS01 [Cosmosporella sp. VM-42]